MAVKIFRRMRRRKRKADPDNHARDDDDLNKKKNPNVNSDDDNTETDSADFTQTHNEEEDDPNQMLEEVMADNLDLMLEIVLRLREDEDYAKNLYADCPRLQHMLDQNPDLRPIFEDPHLVRLNFEQVYRKAGGVLPEDEPSKFRKIITCIVTHPLFKVFRFLLLIKKCYNFFIGGGFLMLRNLFLGMFGVDHALDAGASGIGEDGVDANTQQLDAAANKEALAKAAQHMEKPEVQEQMKVLLASDPEDLEEAIENDPELRALRESNPLCAELMNDPDTMKILVDPDNLRALSDCPDMIQEDFNDPNWTPPDVESVPFDEDGGATTAPTDIAAADLVDGSNNNGGFDGRGNSGMDRGSGGSGDQNFDTAKDETDEVTGIFEDYERGDEPNGAGGKKEETRRDRDRNAVGGGIFATIGMGLTDFIAAETLGITAGDILGEGDEFDNLADEVEGKAQQEAERQVYEQTEDLADRAAEIATSDEFAEGVEQTMDEAEEARGEQQHSGAGGPLQGAGLVGVGMVAGGIPGRNDKGENEGEADKQPSEQTKKIGRFGAISGAFGMLAVAVKENVASAILGDDLGGLIAESMEDDKDKKNEHEEGNLETNSNSLTSLGSKSKNF